MSLSKFIGQKRVKQQINILLERAKREPRIPNMGIYGKTGEGKTRLAEMLAEELDAKFVYINSTAIRDHIAFLSKIREAKKDQSRHHMIFIDECHRLPTAIQENMLSMLEHPATFCYASPKNMGRVRTRSGGVKEVNKGDLISEVLARNIFFVLATTHRGYMRETILNRLVNITLDPYTIKERIDIIKLNLEENGMHNNITDDILAEIAKIGKNNRETTTHANGFNALLSLRKPLGGYMDLFHEYCTIYGIDPADGCGPNDIAYLKVLAKHRKAGLKTMVALLGISEEEITSLIEPFLLQKDYITITPRGRTLTSIGQEKMCSTGQDVPTTDFLIED